MSRPLPEEKIVELIERYRRGDQSARDILVEQKLPLVFAVAKKFEGRGDLEDLRQVGSIGLIKAIERFDPGRGVKFVTYATSLIVGEIRQFIRDKGHRLKISRQLQETSRRVREAKDELMHSNQREPTIMEIAEKLGLPPSELVWAMEATEEKTLPLEELERAENRVIDEAGDWEEQVVNRLFLQKILMELKGKERQIIFLRYFEDKTQEEVARELDISQVHVSRLERKILRRLKLEDNS